MWEILVLPSYTHSWNLGNLPRLLGPIAAGGMGFFLYAAAATGALLSITKNSNRRLIVGILFIGVISTDLFLSRTSWNSQMNISSLRLFYPLIGLACLLGSDLIMSFPVIPRNLALTIILIDTGMRGGVYLKNMSLDSGIDSTRSEAATWINAHIPSDSQVGLSRYPEPAHTPPFRYDHYHLVIFQNVADLKLPPEYLVIDHAARKNIALWTKKNYALIKSFEPVSIGWATVRDDSFFANTGIYIYKRSGLPEK